MDAQIQVHAHLFVMHAVLTDECEIIVTSSLCLSETNTGINEEGGGGGIKTKPECKLKR
jgi:hypothetical protein